MKKIAVALLAALTLSSCSLAEDELLSSELPTEPETTAQTFVFTGLPDIPSLRTDTETETVPSESEPEPESEKEPEQTTAAEADAPAETAPPTTS